MAVTIQIYIYYFLLYLYPLIYTSFIIHFHTVGCHSASGPYYRIVTDTETHSISYTELQAMSYDASVFCGDQAPFSFCSALFHRFRVQNQKEQNAI